MRIGTRHSPLAQAQTDAVIAKVGGDKILVASSGDQDQVRPLHHLDAPGAFTHALTEAILDGRIDAAVHSLKDLPLKAPKNAPVVAVLKRQDPGDILLVRSTAVDGSAPLGVRRGSRVGTSAPRRQAQIEDADPSLVCLDIRGNIQTRIGLLEAGVVDALVMAAAVLERIPVRLPADTKVRKLDPTRFPGSPGQGAIAVQSNPHHTADLRVLDHDATRAAVDAERAVLAALGGGCGLPLGCLVQQQVEGWNLWATYRNAATVVRVHVQGRTPSDLVAPAVYALTQAPAEPTPIADSEGPVILLSIDDGRIEPYRRAMPHARVAAWPLVRGEDTGAAMPPASRDCRWIAVTSRRAAAAAKQAFAAIIETLGEAPRVAAVGAATAMALREHGLPVHVVAPDGTGAGLADAIAAFPKAPTKVLVPQAEAATPHLKQGLARHGFAVVPWPVYRTISAPATPRPDCDVVVLCSGSAARAYAEGDHPAGPRLVAFGPTTAAAMRTVGLPVHATCGMRSPEGLCEAIRSLEILS